MSTTDMRHGDTGVSAPGGRHSAPHEHRAIVVHALRQRAGVPYEVERRVCVTCARVLEERPLRRADT